MSKFFPHTYNKENTIPCPGIVRPLCCQTRHNYLATQQESYQAKSYVRATFHGKTRYFSATHCPAHFTYNCSQTRGEKPKSTILTTYYSKRQGDISLHFPDRSLITQWPARTWLHIGVGHMSLLPRISEESCFMENLKMLSYYEELLRLNQN